MKFVEKIEWLIGLENIVRDVGQQIIGYKGRVYDTRPDKNESNIDGLAYQWVVGAVEKYLPEFKGKIFTETRPLQMESGEWILRIDELDGTTNAKRCLASKFNYLPLSTVSVALCKNENMDSIVMGSVYDMNKQKVFSGTSVEDGHLAFCDGVRLLPSDFKEKNGDVHTRVMVPCYFNKAQLKKGEIGQVLADTGIVVYDGCRTTTQDILSIIHNQFDAYIDARAIWPKEHGAQLKSYDVAGIIPIALGCGLEVSDIYGKPLAGNGDDPVSLIVARPGMTKTIVELIKPVIDKQREER